jgi:AraC family transcriptional regulator, glycine betaine-responsive activator
MIRNPMIFAPAETPLRVACLILPDASLLSFAATIDPMRAANRISGRILYEWVLVSPDGEPVRSTCGVSIPVAGALEDIGPHDVLIVIAGFHVLHHATSQLMVPLRRAAMRSRAIGGVEAGAWVLALAGLLDGRSATTHWEDLEDFAARFPDVQVRADRYVIDGRVFTTGGASPALDLMLHLIRCRQGAALALDVASVFIYEEVKASTDAQPLVSLGSLSRREPRVAKAIRLMEERIDAPPSIEAIARRVGVTPRTLETLFRKSVGTTPGAYFLTLRLNAARRLLVDARLSAAEIAVRTGFSSTSAFSRAFKARFGESPRAARGRNTP